MGRPAEARELVCHILNVSYPYNYTTPKWALIGEGVEELNEEFEADEEDVQYIHEKTKTRNIKGYTVGFDIELKYIKNNEVQRYANRLIRKPPTGSDTSGDYIRVNKDEPMYGTANAYIGVRRKATVYPSSVGGSAEDSLQSSLHISGNTEPEVGYVTFTKSGDTTSYSWTSAPTNTPIITSPANGETISETNVTVRGTGIVNADVTVYYGVGSSVSATVNSAGEWTASIPTASFESNNAVIAAKQTSAGVDSVTSELVSFTVVKTLASPVITAPENNATVDSLKPTISGTGVAGATVTVNSVTPSETTQLCTTTVGNDSTWTTSPSENLTAETNYTINAIQVLNGVTSTESTSVTFTTPSAQ